MNNLRILLILTCLMAINAVKANVVTENQARSIATRFMADKAMPSARLQMVHKAPRLNASRPNASKAAYYVFNSTQPMGGYVIVAGDDRAPAVLGYSDNGTFDADDVPPAMQEWLDSYAEQIAALDNGARPATLQAMNKVVRPLVTAIWSQSEPYNISLPFYKGEHVYTGCVATAMAQIMHYWKWPTWSTKSVPAYTSEALSIYMPSLPPTSFQWDLMQPTYLMSDTTSDRALAVATLMKYCAQSVEMNFKESSSSASSSQVPIALSTYFGYKPSAIYKRRINYTTAEWESLIFNELAASRPVYYSGSKMSSGHAFVCDGYDGHGMFHINWGWNGNSNGYFLLSVLNPDIQGTGSASGSYGYVLSQAAITGIEPGTEMPSDLTVTSKYIEVISSQNTRLNSNYNFSVTLLTHFANYMEQTISFDYGWGLYKDGNLIQTLNTDYVEGLDSWYYIHPQNTMNVGSGISTGTYRIVPIYSKRYAHNWKPCDGSNVNYVEMVINGNTCTFTSHGASNTPDYSINDITCTGNMHPNRPVDITVNVTNRGNTRNDIMYMVVNGKVTSSGFVDVETGTAADVIFTYTPSTTGFYTFAFSFNKDGSSPLASRSITINAMPQAALTGIARALNVTDKTNRVITSNKFSVDVTVYNVGSTTYDEDISIRLYKNIYGSTGTLVQGKSKRVVIPPGQSTVVRFDLENVIDGWRYFAKTYYYSAGDMISLAGVGTHTIVFPGPPPTGDVNCDGEVSIADINSIINLILTGIYDSYGDVNGDGEVSLADINATINLLLN